MPQTQGLTTLGVDVGGTKILAAVVDSAGQVLAQTRRQTPAKQIGTHQIEAEILSCIAELRAIHNPIAVGIGAAGFVNAEGSQVIFAPHLAWRNQPVQQDISRHIKLPVVLDNDANTAIWAEHKWGAARGHSTVLGVNLGTGIGGGIIIDHKLFRGAHGLAGEFGHMQLVPQGRLCECGQAGCWEQYASGSALVRRAQGIGIGDEAVASRVRSWQLGAGGGLTGPQITAAAKAGDSLAVQLFNELGHWLGVGLAQLCAAFDPGVLVIGGGVSAAGSLLLDPAQNSFAQHLSGRGYRTLAKLRSAELGNFAGVLGAARLAQELCD